MSEGRQLYLMISRTDTGIGKMIRTVSHYEYNHVSVTLDPSLQRWYSFARYSQNAPLFGGFICEPAERFLAGSGDAQVQIFRLEIPEYRARELESMLGEAGKKDSGLIYNHFDALAAVVGLRIPVPQCHTCLSFACWLLDCNYNSIRSLSKSLEPFMIYEGSLASLVPDSGSREDPYFTHLGLVTGWTLTFKLFSILTWRTVLHGFDSYKAHRFRRTTR